MYLTKKYVNFISFREKKGEISFLPYGKECQYTPDGRWSSKNRQTMKPAKFARSILNPYLAKRLNDKHFNSFATRFKSFEESTESVLEESTFEIAYTENEATWAFETGSCMRNKPVSDFYSSFNCRPLIIKTKENKITGRAILWDNVEIVSKSTGEVIKSGKYLDRLYCPPEFARLFIEYAENNDYIHRGITGSLGQIYYEGHHYTDHYVRVKSNETYVGKWAPYLDTFRYGSYDGCTLYNYPVKNDYKYRLDDTHGSISDNGYQQGYIHVYDGGFYAPSDCVEYSGTFYLKGGTYTALLDDGTYCYHRDPDIISIDNRYYRKSSDKIAICDHTGMHELKQMLVTCWNSAGREVKVHKRYAGFYHKEKIEKVEPKQYKFKLNTSTSDYAENVVLKKYWKFDDLDDLEKDIALDAYILSDNYTCNTI
jgi:hypothetical protein